jgi:hypothetical protein
MILYTFRPFGIRYLITYLLIKNILAVYVLQIKLKNNRNNGNNRQILLLYHF